MGNRAVITTEDVNKKNKGKKLGIYLHWYGSQDTVETVLAECKDKGIRTPQTDYAYFWARFCQIFADMITIDTLEMEKEFKSERKSSAYETGIGIDVVSNLDCCNGDNGVYYIDDNLNIVKHTDGSELED